MIEHNIQETFTVRYMYMYVTIVFLEGIHYVKIYLCCTNLVVRCMYQMSYQVPCVPFEHGVVDLEDVASVINVN